MDRPARPGALAGVEQEVLRLLALLETDLAGTSLLLPSILPLGVTHGQLARTRLLLPLGRDHCLAHTDLADEEFDPTQFNRLARFQSVPLGLAILVLLLADNEIGLLLSEGNAVGLLGVGPFRTDFAESVIGVVNKIQPEAMGCVGYRLHFELGQELELILINGWFLAISGNDYVGCVSEGGTLTFSIEGNGLGGEWEGEGIGGDLVGLVVEE